MQIEDPAGPIVLPTRPVAYKDPWFIGTVVAVLISAAMLIAVCVAVLGA